MNSYVPKLLRADLTSATLEEEVIPQNVVIQFVGGRGFGVRYLYQELSPGTEPLSPANKLIFNIGPLAGTGALSFSRWIVITKSPLTGSYFRSVGGADFGAWLRFAGLQMIIIEGRAAEPVYLYIEDGHYEIRDASELWGEDTVKTQRRLKQIHGDGVRVACIGPAGEKLVRYASILSDRRTAGRGGVGAVMGSKNLKAIVVRATTRKVTLPNADEFKVLIKEQAAGNEADPSIRGYRAIGTLGNIQATNVFGIFPTRNFREGSLDDWENISAPEYAKIKVKDHGCYVCPVQCGKLYRVPTGPYAGASNEGPEYETIWAFAGSIASTDIGATVAADTLCDDLGVDTISMGNTIGFAYVLFERGIISLKDTDGLALTYGNYEAAIELIKRIGNRQGFGDVLAEGTRRAASYIGKGAEAYAMHVKGLELPGYDPRGAKRHGLGYVTSPIGGSHNIGYVSQEIHNGHGALLKSIMAPGGIVFFSRDLVKIDKEPFSRLALRIAEEDTPRPISIAELAESLGRLSEACLLGSGFNDEAASVATEAWVGFKTQRNQGAVLWLVPWAVLNAADHEGRPSLTLDVHNWVQWWDSAFELLDTKVFVWPLYDVPIIFQSVTSRRT